jgi:hypothetical protein
MYRLGVLNETLSMDITYTLYLFTITERV